MDCLEQKIVQNSWEGANAHVFVKFKKLGMKSEIPKIKYQNLESEWQKSDKKWNEGIYTIKMKKSFSQKGLGRFSSSIAQNNQYEIYF